MFDCLGGMMEFGCHDYPPYDGCPNMFFMFCTCVFNWALGQKKKGPPKCPQDVFQVPYYLPSPNTSWNRRIDSSFSFSASRNVQERASFHWATPVPIADSQASHLEWHSRRIRSIRCPSFGHPCRSPRPSRYTPGCSWSHPGPQRMVVRNQFQQLRYVGIGWNMVYDGACCIQLYIT